MLGMHRKCHFRGFWAFWVRNVVFWGISGESGVGCGGGGRLQARENVKKCKNFEIFEKCSKVVKNVRNACLNVFCACLMFSRQSSGGSGGAEPPRPTWRDGQAAGEWARPRHAQEHCAKVDEISMFLEKVGHVIEFMDCLEWSRWILRKIWGWGKI